MARPILRPAPVTSAVCPCCTLGAPTSSGDPFAGRASSDASILPLEPFGGNAHRAEKASAVSLAVPIRSAARQQTEPLTQRQYASNLGVVVAWVAHLDAVETQRGQSFEPFRGC